MRRALLVAVLAPATLGACSPGSGADSSTSPPPPGPHVQLAVEAPATTHYEMLCDVRTYQVGPGQMANRYGVDKTGPYKDEIPSPNAHCTAKIVAGPAPITVHLSKPGQTQSMVIDTVGDDGKKTVHMW